MFGKKKKESKQKLIKVSVLLRSERNEESSTIEYDIPDGGSVKIEQIGGDFKIYNKHKNLEVVIELLFL